MGVVSVAESEKSVSNPKYKDVSWLAKKRTSRSSNKHFMESLLVSIAGTITRVSKLSGKPVEKSILRRGLGLTAMEAILLATARAKWQATMIIGKRNRDAHKFCTPCAMATKAKNTVKNSVNKMIVEIYRGTRKRSAARARVCTGPKWADMAVSSLGLPSAVK